MSPSDGAVRPRVLFQLSGSIAAYKACHAISRLAQAGCDVQTVATDSALQFVGPATLEGLTGRPVATDTFTPGSQMDHIHLVRWADLIVLCPATANSINCLAGGVANDLIGTMFLAHDFTKPYVLVPAMNASMYDHPATKASLARLRGWGIEVLEPDAGSLACGEIGPGRLVEPDVIVTALLERIRGATTDNAAGTAVGVRHRVLITAGGTKAPIDGVRAITNTSTGTTGAAIADHFAGRGHEVMLLHANGAVLPNRADSLTLRSFTTFNELDSLLRNTLGTTRFDAVIHLAAVSDYDVDHVVVDGRSAPVDASGKLDSGDATEIHLRKNPKLLSQLKGIGGEHLVVVGFKLTNGATAAQRRAAVTAVSPGTDLIVHNDVTEIGSGGHAATIYRGAEVVAKVDDTDDLAMSLERCINELVRSPQCRSDESARQ